MSNGPTGNGGDDRGRGSNKTPQRNRRTNRTRIRVGRGICGFRKSRYLDEEGRVCRIQPTTEPDADDVADDVAAKHMTQRQLAPRLDEAYKRLDPSGQYFDAQKVYQLEAGTVDLSPNLLKAVAEALALDPWEEAALLEWAGFDGTLAFMKGVFNVPSMPTAAIRTLLEKVATDPAAFSLTMEELEELFRLWTHAFFKELRRTLSERDGRDCGGDP